MIKKSSFICLLLSFVILNLTLISFSEEKTKKMVDNLKYVAEINNVKEINLIGYADYHFWEKYLTQEQLTAYKKYNSAEITFSITDLNWWNIGFKEFNIFISIGEKNNPEKLAGYFLIHSFNTNSFFAYSERNFFSVPSYEAKIFMKSDFPFEIKLKEESEIVFSAKISNENKIKEELDYIWNGPVYLPNITEKQNKKVFYVKLSGKRKVYPFIKEDSFVMKRLKISPVFEYLKKSNFRIKDWTFIDKAKHSKSDTYNRK